MAETTPTIEYAMENKASEPVCRIFVKSINKSALVWLKPNLFTVITNVAMHIDMNSALLKFINLKVK